MMTNDNELIHPEELTEKIEDDRSLGEWYRGKETLDTSEGSRLALVLGSLHVAEDWCNEGL